MISTLLAATSLAAASPAIGPAATEHDPTPAVHAKDDDQEQPTKAPEIPRHGFMGIRFNLMDRAFAQALGTPVGEGIFVQLVTTDGPAAKADIRPGDVILSIDGNLIRSADDYNRIIEKSHPSQTASLKILRLKDVLVLQLAYGTYFEREPNIHQTNGLDVPPALAPRPKPVKHQQVNLVKDLGALALTMKRQYARQIGGIPLDIEGVILSQIDPKSDLSKQGLVRGDIILSINLAPVRNLEELQGAISSIKSSGSRQVLLRVFRHSQQPGFIPVLLP